jgi:hypothetical protein
MRHRRRGTYIVDSSPWERSSQSCVMTSHFPSARSFQFARASPASMRRSKNGFDLAFTASKSKWLATFGAIATRLEAPVSSRRVGDGLFYNIDGSFVVTCPICEYSRLFGEGDGEYVHDSFNAWCESPYQATMRCPVCESASPLRDWRSSNQTFAACYLAFTFWGGYLTALFEKPTPPAGEYLRRLVGDVSDSWIPVFCHI